jgi:hypothetical protein
MAPSDSRERFVWFAIGTLVILGPALILVITLQALLVFGDLGEITAVEFLELYLIDLFVFVGFAYGIYRLIVWLVENRLPPSRETGDGRDATDSEASGGNRGE